MISLAQEADSFVESRQRFETILTRLESDQAAELSHGELEEELELEGRALLRQLLQDHSIAGPNGSFGCPT